MTTDECKPGNTRHLNCINILCVDDEPALLELCKLYLERDGHYNVDTAISALSALDLLKKNQYQAIISDYQMPEMDGIELLKTVRDSGSDIPFIVFTGKGREEVVIEALNEGADYYLQKGGKPKPQYTELAHKINLAIQKRQAERDIRGLERRESDILNFLPDATFAIDRSGHVIAWNKAIEEMTGVSAAEILGKGDYEYALPFYGIQRPILIDLIFESRDVIAKKYTNVIHDRGVVLIADTSLPHPRGHTLTLMGKASPLYNQQGEVIGAIESIRDITDPKRAEEGLQESKGKLSAMLRSLGDHMSMMDKNLNILWANNVAKGIFGDDIIGKKCYEVYHGRNKPCEPFPCLTLKAFEDDQVHKHETLVQTHDGKTLAYACTASVALRDNQEKPTAVIEISRDITERKQWEEALTMVNRKLNLINNITRHDINNQLTVLRGCLEILEDDQPDLSHKEYFQKVTTAAERISSMIQFTKTYEDISVAAPVWQDARTVVETAAKEMTPASQVQIINDLPHGTEVFACPMLEKVFYNQIDNAVRHGGKVTTVRFSSEERAGDLIVLCEDDGVGIPMAEKEKIFERGVGKNTGFGLFLTREILSITGITIKETGEPGKGARFKMTMSRGNYQIVSQPE